MKTLRKKDWFPADGFPIVVEIREPQGPFDLHTHDFSEIVIVTGGKATHHTGDDSFVISTGDVFVIGGSRSHEYLHLENLHLINILYDPAKIPMNLADLPTLPGFHALFTLEPMYKKQGHFKSLLRLSTQELTEIKQFVTQIQAELSSREIGFGSMAMTIFLQIVTKLSRYYINSHDCHSALVSGIADVISHIEQHYDADIPLDDLVSISGMSRRNFLRLFKQATGTSPILYLIRIRIRNACSLLTQSTHQITEIAFIVGFTDSNYFTRQFKKITGTSPVNYRKQMGKMTDKIK